MDSISLIKSNISSRLDSIQSIENDVNNEEKEKEKDNENANQNQNQNSNNCVLNIDLLKQIEKERQIIKERNNSNNMFHRISHH